MTSNQKVAILGSTGSIGTNAIEVVESLSGFEIFALSAHARLPALAEQTNRHSPQMIVASSESRAAGFDWSILPRHQLASSGTAEQTSGAPTILTGESALESVARHPEVDVVVAAIVGSAGLKSTWAAIDAGKKVALANKETLVMAGQLAMELAEKTGARILPVDSEHSAIFQALHGENRKQVRKVILTASGGPFRNAAMAELRNATVQSALAHPTWKMGPKITIDSATMMNKSLELIEARWLFDLRPEQLEVVIHPQSIVHSLVEFVDGSIMAQLSPPDMKLPIQYALTYPDRFAGPTRKMDFSQAFDLEFQPPDYEKFPALLLGKEVAEKGGTTGAVLNAANEAAVEAFLDGRIQFLDITKACREVMNHHEFNTNPDLDELFRLDGWARKEIKKWIAA
ncbi:MAG: 1-deoxy-D-xylulose-5-phosphate reductoisomerase [Planctomycetota bacterium]|nr:1-deoxy-D-xylulose-5-phosphate reductoisomerase [Planctomycetota bacterium]